MGFGAQAVEDEGDFCGAPGDFRWNQKNVRESSCAVILAGHRTSPTPSGNGRRDDSETRVHTLVLRLAADAAQRLGDEAAGTGDDECVDRKRHRYRSPEGPLRLILARALLSFPGGFGWWFRDGRQGALLNHRRFPIPLNHGENSSMSVDDGAQSVEQ